jgi:hypothetical protein
MGGSSADQRSTPQPSREHEENSAAVKTQHKTARGGRGGRKGNISLRITGEIIILHYTTGRRGFHRYRPKAQGQSAFTFLSGTYRQSRIAGVAGAWYNVNMTAERTGEQP